MGNRAFIYFKPQDMSLYLHWHGGAESVAAFLKCADEFGVYHDDNFPARLTQIIGNFFGGTLSLGLCGGQLAGQGQRYTLDLLENRLCIIHRGTWFGIDGFYSLVKEDASPILQAVSDANREAFVTRKTTREKL